MSHEYRTVPLKVWQYQWLIDSQPAAEGGKMALTSEQMAMLAETDCWTIACDGDPIICGGFIPYWSGRCMAWTYMGANAGPHIVHITRVVREKLAAVKGRIEMTVRADFANGLRWARMLGFTVETPCMKGYGPLGEDHVGFVRFN